MCEISGGFGGDPGPAYRIPLEAGCAPKITISTSDPDPWIFPLNSITRGDLNLNGLPYEMSDLVTLINIALRSAQPDERLLECWPVQADLDYNGRLNLVDIVRMCQVITGKLPLPSP